MWLINRLIVTQSLACVALKFDAAVARRQLTEVMNLDRDFHEKVAAAAHNRMPAEIMKVLPARLRRFWAISLADERHLADVQAEHTAIIDALERNDGSGGVGRA